jgi:hypothetical protein
MPGLDSLTFARSNRAATATIDSICSRVSCPTAVNGLTFAAKSVSDL